MGISATIITLNEQENIGRAIRSVAFCNEVVVVDCGSTDRTTEIARSLHAIVESNPWPGFAAQKNHAAACARNDWILSLDADEAVTPELAESIASLDLPASGCAGYDFPRLARYCGRWIRHSGWYPDRKVRLYDRRLGRWHGQHVHESVRVTGPVGHLQGDLLHFTCDSLRQHRRTVERYTDLAAREIVESGASVGPWRRVAGPPLAFLRSYVLKLGVLDGGPGLTIARMAARYVYLKHRKALELGSH